MFEDSTIGNLDKVKNSGNRSRVGGAELRVYSEAQGRISWLGFMREGDFWKVTWVWGIFRDLFSRRIWI
jgi:hypothetical protein